jgi:hypothetical protein
VKIALLLGVLVAVAVALVPQATARQNAVRAAKASKSAKAVKAVKAVRTHVVDARVMTRVLAGITRNRDETWRWQKVMQRPKTPYSGSAAHNRSLAYSRWALQLWNGRALRARRRAQNPPHKSQWLCIHHYEGSWTDPNAPYYGGLQMDLEFQSTYGGTLLRAKGTADHWTPLEQMWVAERAFSTRGFWPWPNTARWCGLL